MAVLRKTVTVLFCDVADSTPLGERLDPEVLQRVMARYYAEMSAVLERHGGTVEKFIGDAVMAVFGIPAAHDDDALRAVRAAAEMRAALAELNAELRRDFDVDLSVCTGVNTGEVIAGDPSGGQAFATGHAVVVAERLQKAARGGEILLGDATRRLVENAAFLEPLEPLELKGKSEPVEAWRLIAVLEGAPAFARRLDTPMVGRVRELAQLRGAFDEAVAGRACRLVTVVGEAGIGKSKLVNELLTSERHRASVLVGHCLPYGEGITYWPLRDVIRGAAGELSQERIEELLAGEDDAGRIAARVAATIGIGDCEGATGETPWAVRRLLERLARERPLIVGLDDLQWAEPTFLDLVEYLVRSSRDAPILFVCLARPELLDRHPTWLAVKPNASSIALEPLSEEEAESLLERLRGDTELQPEVLARIMEAAEGNPLFVEQMLAMLTENGASADDSIPPSIHALLAARLDRLQPEERALIERASVVGKEFWRGAVAHLSGGDEGSIGPGLMELARKDLVEPSGSIFPSEDGFRFRHILIRDAAYLAMPKEVRADLHERFADWLESTAGERAADEILGYHLEQAYRYREELGPTGESGTMLARRAGERLAAAGRSAILVRGDVSAAATLVGRAVALLPPDHPDRPALLTELGRGLMRTGDFGRAERVLDEALAAAVAAGDRRLELRTRIEREFCRSFTDPEGSALDDSRVADETIPELEELGDDLGLAKAWWLKSDPYVNACRWGARAEALEKALEHAKRSGDAAEVAAITALLAHALYYGPTPVAEAIERCEHYLHESPENRALEASVTAVLAGLHAMEGDFDRARNLHSAAHEIHEELGQRLRIVTVAALIAAEIEQLAGRPGEAVSILGEAFDTLQEMGVTSSTATIAAFLAEAFSRDHRYDEAADVSSFSEEHAPASDVVTQVLWRAGKARALAAKDAAAAEALAREALATARETDQPDLEGRALRSLAEVLGSSEEAESLRAEATTLYERKGNVAAAAQS